MVNNKTFWYRSFMQRIHHSVSYCSFSFPLNVPISTLVNCARPNPTTLLIYGVASIGIHWLWSRRQSISQATNTDRPTTVFFDP